MACILSCCCCSCPYVLAILFGSAVAVKLYLKWTTGMCTSSRRMDGKTVIVTGANTGIGKETALDMAWRRARVIMACRNMDKANVARDDIIRRTGNKDVVVREVNLSSLTSVREFAAEILATEVRLDVLVNNAGIAGSRPRYTEDNLIAGMQVNHFAPFLLTNLLLDLLKKSAPSRIIFVSSKMHEWANFDINNLNLEKKKLSPLSMYNCSKLANVLTANELARRLKNTGVTVNGLHPGLVQTDIFRKHPKYIMIWLRFILKTFCKTATEGAQTTIHLAVSEEVEGVTGKYFSDCKENPASHLAQDVALAKKLWKNSENLVKMQSKKVE